MFWLDFAGKKVMITYYPVFDEDDKYCGVIEFSRILPISRSSKVNIGSWTGRDHLRDNHAAAEHDVSLIEHDRLSGGHSSLRLGE